MDSIEELWPHLSSTESFASFINDKDFAGIYNECKYKSTVQWAMLCIPWYNYILLSLLISILGSDFIQDSYDHCLQRPSTHYNNSEGTMANTPIYHNDLFKSDLNKASISQNIRRDFNKTSDFSESLKIVSTIKDLKESHH